MNAIEVKDLTKTFGAFTAVDHITFDVKKVKFLVSLEQTEQERPLPCACSVGYYCPAQVQVLWPDMTLQPKVKTSKRT